MSPPPNIEHAMGPCSKARYIKIDRERERERVKFSKKFRILNIYLIRFGSYGSSSCHILSWADQTKIPTLEMLESNNNSVYEYEKLRGILATASFVICYTYKPIIIPQSR